MNLRNFIQSRNGIDRDNSNLLNKLHNLKDKKTLLLPASLLYQLTYRPNYEDEQNAPFLKQNVSLKSNAPYLITSFTHFYNTKRNASLNKMHRSVSSPCNCKNYHLICRNHGRQVTETKG